MMGRTTDQAAVGRRGRASVAVAAAILLIASGAVRADDRATCASTVARASKAAVASTLKCIARGKRAGHDRDAGCVARAVDAMRTKASRLGPACARAGAAAGGAVRRCMASVCAEISGAGVCGARKARAARASLTARDGSALCRAFAKAGDCAGRCEAVAAELATCQPPAPKGTPSADAQLILFGAYEGEAMSTVSVSGQDAVTQTARVVVSPGSTPLYVVLASYESVIWRFEGATERVSGVALAGWSPHGVTGIAADRVLDLRDEGGALASYFYDTPSPEASAMRAAVEARFGRPVDVVAGSYGVGTLTLPDAIVEASPTAWTAPPGFDPSVWLTATWFTPGGVVAIDPAQVVAVGGVEPYDVIPQEFGLAQLVASGALELHGDAFYIARPMRFPAGLYGAHSVTFILGRGVPMPAGDPGHSCVVSEETGLPAGGGFLCWNLPPEPRACELPAAPAADRIVAFGTYEGDALSTASVVGMDDTTRTARLVVEPGAEPLYVVLSSFTGMVWRVEGAVARIDRIVLVGGYGQGVTGVEADRVTDLAAGDFGSSACFDYYYDPSSADGVVARGALERALGRPVDAFLGTYAVGTVGLPSGTTAGSPMAPTPAGWNPVIWALGTWFVPGGIVAIDPAQVVSSSPVAAYDVLPEALGLAQLETTGAIELREDAFWIVRAIPRFPAQLAGSESVRFVLGTGVPMPGGSPGHSCVISEETGLPLANDFLCDYPMYLPPVTG